VSDLAAVYLIHGDDDARIEQWRTRVRRRAEAELGPGGLEVFDAGTTPPAEVAAALATLSFSTGTRYIAVTDAGAWKAAELDPILTALGSMPPDTVIVLLVRGKPLRALVTAVEKADGQVRDCPAPKPWEMARWVIERARDQGLELDSEAAKTLLAIVGPGQSRIARELEKLALAVHPDTAVHAEEVERLCGRETTPKVYDLADAVVAGDTKLALALAEELASQDERPSRFVYPIVNRLREVNRVLELLDSGVSEKDLAREMKAPGWRVKKAVALARRSDRETLRAAICRFAELELELRGGSALDEDTAVTLALARSAA
jgi:DNA polymerase III subunit delta